MKILMLGWEYPPNITGGLGIASQGIAESLAGQGHRVYFLLPRKHKEQVSLSVKLIDASSIIPNRDLWKTEKEYLKVLQTEEVGEKLLPYLDPKAFEIAREKQVVVTKLEKSTESDLLDEVELTGTYSESIFGELTKYALLAVQFAKEEAFDVIHAHDWITLKAGRMIKQLTGTPLFAHLHSTEYDRNPLHPQYEIIQEEESGLEHVEKIFAVSTKLKEIIIDHYGIESNKIVVVPNSVSVGDGPKKSNHKPNHIAFIGRLTSQKSPSRLIDIARELTSLGHDFKFSIIGDGYLKNELEEKIHRQNLSNRFTLPGFLDRSQLLKSMSSIDLLVVPSVAEPFGLVILEAIQKSIPVAAAKGVGIAEFIPSLPLVEHWDLFSYTKLVDRLMTDQPYRAEVIEKCSHEARHLSWEKSATIVIRAYKEHVKSK